MSLFGEDPIRKLLDEEYRRQKAEADEQDVTVGPDWPYAVRPVSTTDIAGREMLMKADDGNTYAGSEVRGMMESRRYRQEDPTWFGYTKHPVRGVEEVGIPHFSLFKHTAIFGTSGYGKSTVMKNMMHQWVEAGYGMAFLDPKGDDSTDMLQTIPAHRLDDVLWVEPGSTKKTDTIGFNFFDTYSPHGSQERQQEANQITDNFITLLKDSTQGWESQMGGVVRAILEPLILAEETYTPVDLFKIIDDPSERVEFLEMFGDDIEELSRSYVAELNSSEVQPLLNRLREIAEKPVLRELLAHDQSTVSITEIVEEGKILLIKANSVGDDLEFIAAAIVRRIWSTIQARGDIPEEEKERTPFYLCIDEFDKVLKDFEDAPDMMKIGNILSKARSLRLSVLLANQQPSQIPEDIQQEVQSNSNNTFSFGLASYADASPLANAMDIDPPQIMELGQFQLLGRVTIDGNKSEPLLISTFAEYPPIRTTTEADLVVDTSIERYGSPRKTETGSLENYGVSRFNTGETSNKRLVGDGVELTQRHVLTALYAASFQGETFVFDEVGGWVPEELLKRSLQRHAGNAFEFSEIREKLILSLVGTRINHYEESGLSYYRLSDNPQEYIFGDVDTDAGMLMRAFKFISKLGFDITLPTSSTAIGTAIAEPPIKPVNDSLTLSEAQSLYNSLEKAHPDLVERFEDHPLTIVPTSTPLNQPREMAAALASAGEKHCLYVVPETTPAGKSAAEELTLLLSGSFSREPLIEAVTDDGNRRFYTSTKPLDIDGEQLLRGLHKSENVAWQETAADTIALVDENETTLTQYPSAFDVAHGVDVATVPFHCYHDAEQEDVVVLDADQEIIDRYDSMDDVFADGYHIINEPFVPEMIFPSSEFDARDEEWSILVVPEDKDPYFY